MTTCPIYTVGTGERTQMARRGDGVWFMRTRGHANLWGPWVACKTCPYEFGKYIDRRAGNARLPDGPV